MFPFTVIFELRGALECPETLVKGSSRCLGISDSDPQARDPQTDWGCLLGIRAGYGDPTSLRSKSWQDQGRAVSLTW